jgi:mannobiose 2-epimerase
LWQEDWSPAQTRVPQSASFGHDIETIWLVLDSIRRENGPEALVRGWASRLGRRVWELGADLEHGGIFFSAPAGQPPSGERRRRKEWWAQGEALVGWLELLAITGDVTYADAFRATLRFCENHATRAAGGWYRACRADGTPLDQELIGPWQCYYHQGRGLIEAAQRLHGLASASSNTAEAERTG